MDKYEIAAKYLNLIQRAGARHSARDNGLIQQMHDMCCELGAECPKSDMPVHPMLKAAVEALILRHPGHGSQKVHGNRYGGFSTTKESLRRLKGDKEARERYKASARERSGSPLKGFRENIMEPAGKITEKYKERERLLKDLASENYKPKYRKEREAKVKAIDKEIDVLKRKLVRPGSFVKQQGTSLTGVVTGRGTIKVGKDTIPVFKVRLPGGRTSIIPIRESQLVAL